MVTESVAGALAAWQSFYVIVGSSGGALIGLQFVVVTLLASMRGRTQVDALGAFGTPNVVHLASALVIAAIMSVPWPALWPAGVALAVCGLAGVMYSVVVMRRARRQTYYHPVWEDWLWYVILPGCAYAALGLAALSLLAAAQPALFVIGAAALGLLLIGIHNAWDSVTNMVVTHAHDTEKKAK